MSAAPKPGAATAAAPAATSGLPPRGSSRLDELIEAVRSGDEAAVAATLALGGVDVNARSGLGSTPLVAAAESGNVALLRLLLQVSVPAREAGGDQPDLSRCRGVAVCTCTWEG